MMQIHGFQKLTLLDYPGKVAATIFTGGCNFRCPFCQNSSLVLSPDREPLIPEEEVLSVLKKRQGILDGVCITGGEPTLQPDLPEFIRKIRELGYAIKLDTNGYQPGLMEQLAADGLIDYVAMDIKNCPEKYALTAGVRRLDMGRIRESVEFLKNESMEYEFRTTVCRELHKKADLLAIGEWLAGDSRYFLQGYRFSENVIRPVFSGYTPEQLRQFRDVIRKYLPAAEVRGD